MHVKYMNYSRIKVLDKLLNCAYNFQRVIISEVV